MNPNVTVLPANDADFTPVVIPEQSSPVSVKSPSEEPPFKLVCTQCECEFESDNGFDSICEVCNHDNYEKERDVSEYIFDNR